MTAPEGTALTLNGTAVAENYITERDLPYPDLTELEQRFENLGLRLRVPEEAARRLAEMGRSENSGARPLRRTIRREIVDRAAQLLLEGTLRPGSVVTAVCEGDGIELVKNQLP